jgi:uncharacterized repeat protein (TIGR02543 family)
VLTDPPTGPFAYGSVVKLSAYPAAGWEFRGWSGDLSGAASPTTITMDADKSVRATFVQVEATLSISAGGGGDVFAFQVAMFFRLVQT